jgi:hypothetical protein
MMREIAGLEDRAAGRIGMNGLRAGSDEQRAAASRVSLTTQLNAPGRHRPHLAAPGLIRSVEAD